MAATATTLTTVIGFLPLMLDPTGFWQPLAIAVSGGLVGATGLALFYGPAAHALLMRPVVRTPAATVLTTGNRPDPPQ
jgi:multidrug efflux pump subunit AcrB